MQAHVQPAGGKIEPDGGGGLAAKLRWVFDGTVDRESSTSVSAFDPATLPISSTDGRRADSNRPAHAGCGFARLEFIQQGIVRIAAVADALGFAARLSTSVLASHGWNLA